jgi:HEAT repeat protein
MESAWGGGHRRAAIQGALVQALTASRYKSQAALPFLLDDVGDQYVLAALAQINYGEAAKRAVPELTALLTSQREYDRVWALDALFAVGPTGPVAAVEALGTKPSTRTAILYKLQKVDFRAKEAVPALIACLEDKSATVRALSAERLGAIGPDAKAALPTLDLLLDDSDAGVRAVVQEAMKRIKK